MSVGFPTCPPQSTSPSHHLNLQNVTRIQPLFLATAMHLSLGALQLPPKWSLGPILESYSPFPTRQPDRPSCVCVCVCVCESPSRGRLCDPMDCSPPGSSVQGILQARVLEWVAISFSRPTSPTANPYFSVSRGLRNESWPLRPCITCHPSHLLISSELTLPVLNSAFLVLKHLSLLLPLASSGGSEMTQTVKNLLATQDAQVRSLGQEDPPGERNGYPLRYSCLENPMDRGAWWAVVHGGLKKSDTTR